MDQGFLEEMTDLMTQAEKGQDEPGISVSIRRKTSVPQMREHFKKTQKPA